MLIGPVADAVRSAVVELAVVCDEVAWVPEPAAATPTSATTTTTTRIPTTAILPTATLAMTDSQGRSSLYIVLRELRPGRGPAMPRSHAPHPLKPGASQGSVITRPSGQHSAETLCSA